MVGWMQVGWVNNPITFIMYISGILKYKEPNMMLLWLTVICWASAYGPAGNVKVRHFLSLLDYFFSYIYLTSIQGFTVIIFHFRGGSRLWKIRGTPYKYLFSHILYH